jgi:hypothetical protein
MVLVDHFIDDSVNLFSFSGVFLVGLFSESFTLDHLLLDVSFGAKELVSLILGSLSSLIICQFLSTEVLNVDVGIVLLKEIRLKL